MSVICILQNLCGINVGKIEDQKQFDAVCKRQDLRELEIHYFKGLDISNICNLSELEDLSIRVCDCNFKKSDFEAIAKIKTLKTLNISNGSGFTTIGCSGCVVAIFATPLIVLKKLYENICNKKQEGLNTSDPCNNPNLGLANIKVLKNIEKLYIDECYIDQDALDSFFSLEKLKDLDVYGVKKLDWGKITQANSLAILTIAYSVLSQDNLDDIFSSHITELSLVNVNELKYDKISSSDVTTLHIIKSPLSQEGFETICRCNQLTSLELMSIPDKLDYSCITNLTNLKSLSISRCELDEKDINLLKSLNCETEIYD